MSNTEPVTVSEICYHASCKTTPKWGVSSSVKQKNPDGSDLTLYTCDVHYNVLTTDLKTAGTRYTLFPIGENHMVPPMTPEEAFEELIRERSIFYKAFTYSAVVLVGIVIGPPILLYYGVRWCAQWIYGKWRGA